MVGVRLKGGILGSALR